MALEIHLLEVGDIEVDDSFVVLGRAPGKNVVAKTFAHLILGGEEPILVDTGFASPADLERLGMRGLRTEEQLLTEQLALHDLKLSDVHTIINTHLHLDHCGQNHLFPMTTTVIVNRREMEFAASGLTGAIYSPESIKPMIDRLHTLRALQLLDLELTGPAEISPGVTCLAAGGHTPGSMIILVETGEGTACICGDLVYHVEDQVVHPLDQVSVREPVPVDNSPMSRREELAAIKKALNLGRFLVPMHDFPAVMEGGDVVGRLEHRVPGA